MGNVIILNPQPGQTIEDYVEHDLAGLVKEKPKSLSWEDHKLVVVGKPNKWALDDPESEYTSFFNQLKSLGFEVFEESHKWMIRNRFLSFGEYIVGSKPDSRSVTNDKDLTKSGIYVFGKDFVIASDSLVRNYAGNALPKIKTTEDTVRKFWEIFGIKKVYFLPHAKKTPNIFYSDPWDYENTADLDYTIGSVPWVDIFTVDEEHYREQKDIFRAIESENGIKFVQIKPSFISVNGVKEDVWANNYFSASINYKSKHQTFLIYTPLAPQVSSIPNSEVVLRSANSYMVGTLKCGGGGLHCMTNTAPDRQTYQEFRTRMGYDKIDN